MEQQAAAAGKTVEAFRADAQKGYPLGRIATPEDIADLVCFLGGTATTECTSNPTAGTSTGVAAGQATFAMSGTTDGSSAANTHVVESYVAAGVAQTREPSTATGYFLDEYVGGTKTATRNVAVNFAGTHHDSTDPGILAGGDVGIGVFAFAYPSDLGTDLAVTRVVLRKDTIVLYDRSGQANAPTLGSVTATSGGIPGNFTNTNNQSESAPAISPDGQWIAYASRPSEARGSSSHRSTDIVPPCRCQPVRTRESRSPATGAVTTRSGHRGLMELVFNRSRTTPFVTSILGSHPTARGSPSCAAPLAVKRST